MTEEEKLEIEQELFIQDYPQNSDLAIVFGSAEAEEMKARVYRAVDIFHGGFAPKILFTGGYSVYKQTEGEMMSELAQIYNVPLQSILVENQSKNTFQNALLSKSFLHQSGEFSNLHTVMLISSIWHMARVLFWMKKSFSQEIKYICCPETMTTPSDWHLNLYNQSRIRVEHGLYKGLRNIN